MRTQVQSQASLNGLRIRGCHELWCQSQMLLRSGIAGAVVQALGCNSHSTPRLGTSICCKGGPKKAKKKKKKETFFLGLHLRPMEIPRLGVESELSCSCQPPGHSNHRNTRLELHL